MTDLKDRLNAVRARIAAAERDAGRAPGSVGLVAVSKTVPFDAIRTLAQAGQRVFGESYVQEATHKIQWLADLNLEWHFIGPIQSNKTKIISENFCWVHSVDRLKIAQRLNDQRQTDLPPLNICIQVNVSAENTKAGVAPAECITLAAAILNLPRLRLRGLMAIPRETDSLAEQREQFRVLADLLAALNAKLGARLDTLSMGMSGDLESAIAEGATLVRVGTDIFGERAMAVH